MYLRCKRGRIENNTLYTENGEEYKIFNVSKYYRTKDDVVLIQYLEKFKCWEIVRHLLINK